MCQDCLFLFLRQNLFFYFCATIKIVTYSLYMLVFIVYIKFSVGGSVGSSVSEISPTPRITKWMLKRERQ